MVAQLKNGVDAILGFPWMAATNARFDYGRRVRLERITLGISTSHAEESVEKGIEERVVIWSISSRD
jgi:hypothetical protein